MEGMRVMVKGINRQIIEVSDTQSDYFERALFFVNPDYSDAERAVLEHEARRTLRKMSRPAAVRERRRRHWLLIRLALAALGGAAVAVAVTAALIL